MRLLGTALLAALCFAAIPFFVSIRVAADNILVQRQFDPTFGPETTFSMARSALRLAWALNAVNYLLLCLAIAALTRRRSFAGKFLLASVVAGCLVAVPVVLLQPLRVWSWLSLGPIGAMLAAVLDAVSTRVALLKEWGRK